VHRIALVLAMLATLALAFPVLGQDPTSGRGTQPDAEANFSFLPASPLEDCEANNARGVCVSLESECDTPTRRQLARRSDTLSRFWRVFPQSCQAIYFGNKQARIVFRKDEVGTRPNRPNRIWQQGQVLRSNEVQMYFLPPKTSFYDLRKPPRNPRSNAQAYFLRVLGGFWLQDPRAEEISSYQGPTQIFVVPLGWLVDVDGHTYTAGYMLVTDHFIAIEANPYTFQLRTRIALSDPS